MIAGGTGFEGMLVSSPDGRGKIIKVLNPDVVLIELDKEDMSGAKSIYGKFDLSELTQIPETTINAENTGNPGLNNPPVNPGSNEPPVSSPAQPAAA